MLDKLKDSGKGTSGLVGVVLGIGLTINSIFDYIKKRDLDQKTLIHEMRLKEDIKKELINEINIKFSTLDIGLTNINNSRKLQIETLAIALNKQDAEIIQQLTKQDKKINDNREAGFKRYTELLKEIHKVDKRCK